jgi:tetratricopeptide (TPR) repeat protein
MRAAARRALELDPSLAEALVSLAVVQTVFDWDWKGAETSFDKAIELNPGLALAYQQRGYLMSALGRGDEAVADYRRALDLDPLSVVLSAQLGLAQFLSRRYTEATDQLREAIAMDPSHYYPHPFLGLVDAETGRFEAAIEELETGMRIASNPQGRAQLAYAYAKAGRWPEAEKVIGDLQADAPGSSAVTYEVATAYAAHGDSEQAIRLLERALEEKSEFVIFLAVDPRLDPLRSDARFMMLLQRLGLDG